MIPGQLYDDSTSPPTLIASVRLSTERTAAATSTTIDHKASTWTERFGGRLSLRVVAEGQTSLAWIAALYARQDAGTPNPYSVELVDGDGHSGPFLVAELAEGTNADDVRRFRLVLLSSGQVAYSPAP